MTVTVTLEELRDYERRMAEWQSRHFTAVVKAIQSGADFHLGKEGIMHAMKHAIDGFTEPAPKISDKI